MKHSRVFIISLTLAIVATTASFAAGPKAYVGLFKDNAIAVLDTATNKVLRTIAIPPGPHGLAMTPDGRTVYASSDGDSKVSVIDTATDTVVTTIEMGKSPHGLAMTPDGKTLLAAVFSAGQVAFIDTARNAVIGSVPVSSPHNIAISPDGRTAYVAAQGKGALALVIVDVAHLKQKGTVPLDKTPRALNFSPRGAKLYFTLAGLDSVQVLDTAPRKIVIQPAGSSLSMSRPETVLTRISAFAFEDTIRIAKGDTVTWENTDAVPHTVTSDTTAWSSGDITPGTTFSMTFKTAGTFPYHCDIHPSMQGTVVVQPEM